ncbi:MAG: pyruvate kinase [bacterium]
MYTKTKILATLGPASDSVEMISSLIDAGIDGIRLNFSHGDFAYFTKVFDNIHSVCTEKALPIPVLVDLQGPKIRIGELSSDQVEIRTGDTIEVTTRDLPGNRTIVSTSYKQLLKDAKLGDTILINDGLINLKIVKKTTDSVISEIIAGGILKSRKGMNLPGMKLSTPSITEKDLQNLEFALKRKVDFIALSFVRSADDILQLREWLTKKGYSKPLFAKIEKSEAVDDFENILEAANGIMVARGDLGVEMGPQFVPVIQKKIIRRCNEVGKTVITATQMLESMIGNPVSTRAEASDVANAVWDGTDVVMLSGETSVGKYPVETVKVMNEILQTAESHYGYAEKINYEIPAALADNLFDSVGSAVANISNNVKAKAIIVFTHFGRKARAIAKFHPRSMIYAISDSFNSLNNLNLCGGIKPFYMKNIVERESAVSDSISVLKENRLITEGDLLIFTAGKPITDKGRDHWIRFVVT